MSGPVLLALRIGLAAALYAFMILALWLIWRDLRRESRRPAETEMPAVVLKEQDNPDGRIFRFTEAEVILGRDPTCNLCMDEKTISARHARLAYHHSQWWVEDLSSTNGTFLNLEAVTGPVVIADGDQLRCGEVDFEVQIESTRQKTFTHHE